MLSRERRNAGRNALEDTCGFCESLWGIVDDVAIIEAVYFADALGLLQLRLILYRY